MPKHKHPLSASVNGYQNAMRNAGYSLSSARKNKILSRQNTDAITQASDKSGGTFRSNDEEVVRHAIAFGVAPTQLAKPGAFAEIACQYPDDIPADLDYEGSGEASEHVALPIGLQKARQIVSLSNERFADGWFFTDLGADESCSGYEKEFIAANLDLTRPVIKWGHALPDAQVAEHQPLFEAIDAAILSRDIKPSAVPWAPHAKGSMQAMIAKAHESTATKLDINSELNFKDEGIRVFHATQSRYFRIQFNLYDHDYVEADEYRMEEIKTPLGEYKFSNWLVCVYHYFTVGPAEAPYIYLQKAPTWNDDAPLEVLRQYGGVRYCTQNNENTIEIDGVELLKKIPTYKLLGDQGIT